MESIFATPWHWQPLARAGTIVTAAPNPSANTSSRGLRQCLLCLVWADSSGEVCHIVLTHLVHFCLFHFSAAPPLYPFCPACIDNRWAPLPSHFPSPLSLCHDTIIASPLPRLCWSGAIVPSPTPRRCYHRIHAAATATTATTAAIHLSRHHRCRCTFLA
jgi:hypothetical protein